MINKKAATLGIHPLILTSISTKSYMYNLGLSSSSSTLLLDGDDIPALKQFKYLVRFRLELDVTDGSTSIVVVLFNEAGEKLVGRTAKCLVEEHLENMSPDAGVLPPRWGDPYGVIVINSPEACCCNNYSCKNK